MKNKISHLPRALDNLESFSQILAAPRVALFSDFDGTLTPIFDDPQDTTLSPTMRSALSELSKKLEMVAVVSGRDVKTLRRMVALNSLTYVGNHGLEIWKPAAEQPERQARIPDGLFEDVRKAVAAIGIPGLSLENKGLSVAIHYRSAPDPMAAQFAISQILNPLAADPDMETREGKMVLEIGPGAEVNKGTAVARLAREFDLAGAIALGDDLTDCDTFDALHELARETGMKGASIAILDAETPEAVLRKADYHLSGMAEVEKFLRWLAYSSPSASKKL